MVVYAEITIPASGFRIGRAFAELSGVRVELDRVVPTADAVVPFLWVRGARPEAVVRVTRERSAVEDIALLDRAAEEALYRVVWNRRARDVAVSIADSALALVTGAGTAEEWTFEFRGEHREPLSAFVRELRADGTPVTVGRLTEDRSRAPRRRNPLTDAQFEALGLAYAKATSRSRGRPRSRNSRPRRKSRHRRSAVASDARSRASWPNGSARPPTKRAFRGQDER